MKGDVRIYLQDDGFDIGLADGDLAEETGLETAAILSLFTNRRVTAEELPELAESREGWFGDLFPDVEGDQIGSKLWTLAREKRTLETLRKGEDYSKDALQWMIDDGIASAIRVTASFDDEVSSGRWYLDIEIEKPSGTSRFKVLWDQQKLIRG